LIDQRYQPRQLIRASGRLGDDISVEFLKTTQAAFDFAGGGELVADLGRQFRDGILGGVSAFA
jgi:hypothetical protein